MCIRDRFQADGELQVSGAVVQPVLSGNLGLSRGTLRPQSGSSGRARRKQPQGLIPSVEKGPSAAVQGTQSFKTLLEEEWDFKDPLVLMGPNTPINGPDQP